MSGDQVHVVSDEKTSREIAQMRSRLKDATRAHVSAAATLEDLIGRVKTEELPELPIILKADTQGSVEAISEALIKLNASKQVRCTIVHRAVGGINESDLNLAETSKSVVIGFNVRAARGLDDEANRRGVVLKYYSIIYELIDTVKSLMAGKLPPIATEVVLGHAQVRNPISVPRIGLIAGSFVMDGKITRTSQLRLVRDDVVIYSGRIGSLRRFKDDVKEVTHGYECGISIDGYNDVKIGDVIEAYTVEESVATLDL
jgi:translation initiation factor IF-2